MTNALRCSAALCLAAGLLLGLGACGVAQTVKEATAGAARAIFVAQPVRLKLDLVAREGVNGDAQNAAMSVVARIYQLKDGRALAAAPYEQVLSDDAALLRNDLLVSRSVLLRPGATLSVDEPLDKATQAVGVVVFFRKAERDGEWKLIIARSDIPDDKPIRLDLTGFTVQRAPQGGR
ncbi:MAG: type VI secretion system lipoprotein TssJ [Candidatus Dactylopiibacterium sp.]|nr:type VI secretion system lipoprotein TssJ [Candidatus Dactylopiibacterium sp.]